MGIPPAFPRRLLIPFFACADQDQAGQEGQDDVAKDCCPADGIDKVDQMCVRKQEGRNYGAEQDEEARAEIPLIR